MLLLLSSILLQVHSHSHRTCISDQIKANHRTIQIQHVSTRHMAEVHRVPIEGLHAGEQEEETPKWRQMRIFVDYSLCEEAEAKNPAIKAANLVNLKLMKSAVTYYQKAFQVFHMERMNFEGGECKAGEKIPAFSKKVDLFIKFFPGDLGGSLAAAMPCYSTFDGRSIVGAYYIDYKTIKTSRVQEYFNFSTYTHEIGHILGFLESEFSNFVSHSLKRNLRLNEVVGQSVIDGVTFKTIVMPGVVAYAREYFKCPTLTGVPLEDNGNSGTKNSHWEKLFLAGEYMDPSEENPGMISMFSLKFFEGTGWYKIVGKPYEPYSWGKGAGCGHFRVCPKSPGYCSKAQEGNPTCSMDFLSKGQCASGDEMNGCFKNHPLKHSCLFEKGDEESHSTQPGEFYGAGSRCVETQNEEGEIVPRCQLAQCKKNAVVYNFPSETAVCTKTGQIVITKDHKLTCPDITRFCLRRSEFNCPKDCSGNGVCFVDRKCFCFASHKGSACSSKKRLTYQKMKNWLGLKHLRAALQFMQLKNQIRHRGTRARLILELLKNLH